MSSWLRIMVLLPVFAGVLISCASTPNTAQPETQTVGASPPLMVATISLSEAEAAMIDAGLMDFAERTIDTRYPSISALQSDGFTIQTTLFACGNSGGPCKGAELLSVMPATTRENAEIIERSIERTVFGFDCSVTRFRDPSGEGGHFAVLISTYLVYDHGVSDMLFPEMLDRLLFIVSQTRDFMLSDDPAHEELWAGIDGTRQHTTDITSRI